MKTISVADEPPILDGLRLILEDNGYKALTFEDPQKLLMTF